MNVLLFLSLSSPENYCVHSSSVVDVLLGPKFCKLQGNLTCVDVIINIYPVYCTKLLLLEKISSCKTLPKVLKYNMILWLVGPCQVYGCYMKVNDTIICWEHAMWIREQTAAMPASYFSSNYPLSKHVTVIVPVLQYNVIKFQWLVLFRSVSSRTVYIQSMFSWLILRWKFIEGYTVGDKLHSNWLKGYWNLFHVDLRCKPLYLMA